MPTHKKLQWTQLLKNRKKGQYTALKQNSTTKGKAEKSKAAPATRKPLSTLSGVNGQDNNSQQPASCAKLNKRLKELSQSNKGFLHFDDIMSTLRTKESKLLTEIDAEYALNTQQSITWTMRSLLVEWMLDIQAQYAMMDETVFAVINYMDVHLSKHPTEKSKLQLLAVTAMNLSSKTYEVRPQSIHEWLYLSQGQYSRKEVLATERKVLESINWNIFQVTPYNYSSSWMPVLRVPPMVEFLFDFVIRVVYVEAPLCLKNKVSHMTAAAICLAFVYLHRQHQLDMELMIAVAEHDPFEHELMSRINDLICTFVDRDRSKSFLLSHFGGDSDHAAIAEKYGSDADEEFNIERIDFKRVFEEFSQQQSKKTKAAKKL